MKDKQKFLKGTRGKKNHFTYSGTKARITSNFSETRQARREQSQIESVEKKKHQPKILYLTKLCLQKEIQNFSDEQKLKGCVVTGLALEEVLKRSSLERGKII